MDCAMKSSLRSTLAVFSLEDNPDSASLDNPDFASLIQATPA
jgi:hypothetical protein